LKAVKQSIRGSIAVEAAMIIPIVIVAVIIILYIMLIIFQTCIMQTTANSIAEKTAAVYYNHKASFASGQITKANIESLGLYRRWISNVDFEQNNFKAVSIERLRKNSVLKSKDISLDILKTGNIINQKITVVIDTTYDNPMGNMTEVWGLSKNINLQVHAEATIDDPAEFIRNTDFVLETALKVPIIKDFQSKWQEIVNKIIDYIRHPRENN
jgi:hypothetical protein